MIEDPLTDVVADQYENWVYPEPIQDLPKWVETNWQWFDPSHSHRLLWPDREYRPGMHVLVAGCGTNQAAVLAYTNPTANVIAIDVSQASLDHHSSLKRAYGLKNLDVRRLAIEEVDALQQEFDLIISTGVLHHMANPQAGMNVLARCLRPDGVIAIMLYARYGRIGVEMMQGLFRDLDLNQDQASLGQVRQALAAIPQEHPLQAYLALAPDLAFDAGIVDTFLHGRDRSFTVEDCLELVTEAGLTFQNWLFQSPYEPPPTDNNDFILNVAGLPNRSRWSVMERINSTNATHFFTACRTDRPETDYRIDFASPESVNYVPAWRYQCGLDVGEVVRPGWRVSLNPEQRELAAAIDGIRTIGMIISDVSDGVLYEKPKTLDNGLGDDSFFAWLWRRDFISVGLKAHY